MKNINTTAAMQAIPAQRPAMKAGPKLASAAVLAWVAVLAACSSTPPTAQMAVSKAAVERADTSAAVDAPVEVAAARAKLNLANAAFAKQDFELARRLAEQAEADAALAESQARSVRSARALAEVREGIRQLRDEMSRK
ncbi:MULTISPECIES: DUF4398 domain-containing protein [Roseateles]|uniref:DUF4398 domain-containing protein n=1 Tax=Roseateles albus TaxID=2987525 RepID=A0ABT5KHM0_9BURK|nr:MULTISPECIES: DUF4398 domain-containing protein [Roseateles]MCV2360562.1 DUF4398 domain-containing protein [Paucibacter sp. TC2R-5]MDC8773407.1 DUF4398 domain-containing protein [Roseateles albus]